MFDIVIRNALIADGTGAACFPADVGIRDGRIRCVGPLPADVAARENIDAAGHVLCPGFIDLHNHSDFLLLRDPLTLAKLQQGITTQVIGQCGISPAPVADRTVALLDRYSGFVQAGAEPRWDWRSFADWLTVLDVLELGTNIAAMVGQGTVRIAVMGFDNRPPTAAELDSMRGLVTDAMSAGAFGLTTGLIYPPGVYSLPEELMAVAAALRESGGLYASHMRSESGGVLASVRETILLAERNGIAAQISHHKAMGRANWGLVKETLALLDQARTTGIDVAADQYPYTVASTTLRAILPPWANEGGLERTIARLRSTADRRQVRTDIEQCTDWENLFLHADGAEGVILVDTPETPEYQGRTLAEIAAVDGRDPLDVAFEAIIANRGRDNCCYRLMSEEDVEYVMRHPWVLIASDAIPCAPGARCHPRSNGTFPRVLGRYVRERGVLRLEEAIRKMTALPAARLGLEHKGQIRPGMDADVVVFDPGTVADQADFQNPHASPVGIEFVLVNGRKVLDHGVHTGAAAGQLLRH